MLSKYLLRLSEIAGSVINCGPVLNWLEMDNRGHRLLVPDTDNCPINTPAVAAAYTVKKYQAQAPDELSFEVPIGLKEYLQLYGNFYLIGFNTQRDREMIPLLLLSTYIKEQKLKTYFVPDFFQSFKRLFFVKGVLSKM